MGTLANKVRAAEQQVKQADLMDDVGSAWSGEGLDTRAPGEKETHEAASTRLVEAGKAPTTGVRDAKFMKLLGMTSSRDEASASAKKWLLGLGGGALAVGALMRVLRGGAARAPVSVAPRGESGIPGRELHIPMPRRRRKSASAEGLEKEAIGTAVIAGTALAAPSVARMAGGKVGDVWDYTKRKTGDAFRHLTAPTGSPLDKPWFLPAAAAATVGALGLSYWGTGKLLDNMAAKRRQRQMHAAKREFQAALRSQYTQSELSENAGTKYSADLGRAVDTLAQAHVSGELAIQLSSLEKAALEVREMEDPTAEPSAFSSWTQGAGTKTMGLYLAMLAAMAAGGGVAGYHLAKSRDPGRQRYKELQRVMRRRSAAAPPTPFLETV